MRSCVRSPKRGKSLVSSGKAIVSQGAKARHSRTSSGFFGHQVRQASWRYPAGGSPAQVSGRARLVASFSSAAAMAGPTPICLRKTEPPPMMNGREKSRAAVRRAAQPVHSAVTSFHAPLRIVSAWVVSIVRRMFFSMAVQVLTGFRCVEFAEQAVRPEPETEEPRRGARENGPARHAPGAEPARMTQRCLITTARRTP
jgi:hypothetical protein